MNRHALTAVLALIWVAALALPAQAQDVTADVKTWTGQTWHLSQPSLEVFYSIVSKPQEESGEKGTEAGKATNFTSLTLGGRRPAQAVPGAGLRRGNRAAHTHQGLQSAHRAGDGSGLRLGERLWRGQALDRPADQRGGRRPVLQLGIPRAASEGAGLGGRAFDAVDRLHSINSVRAGRFHRVTGRGRQ